MMLIFIMCASSLSSYALAADKRIYKVGIRSTIPPFCFLSARNGKISLQGIYIDVLKQVFSNVNAEFEFVRCSSLTMRDRLMQDGRIDIFAMSAAIDLTIPNATYIDISTGLEIKTRLFVHKSSNIVIFENDFSHRRVVVLEGTNYRKHFKKSENVDIFQAASPMDALSMLNKGVVDVYVSLSERVADYLIQQEGYKNIKKVGNPLQTIGLNLPVKKSETRLYEDLAAAVARVRESGALDRILEKWDGVETGNLRWEKVKHLVSLALSCCFLVILFFIVWNHQLNKKVFKAASRLKASESRYRNLIESSPDMMFVLNRCGIIHQMNKEARYFMPSNVSTNGVETLLADTLPSGDRARFLSFIDTVLVRGKSTGAFQFKDRLLAYREIEVTAALLSAAPREESLVCLFARDVTQRNRIDRELVQADRMAIIGQMAADVAHEINNPIGIVRTNIDTILTRGWFSAEAKEFLDSCKRNITRAGDVTRDLLAIARPKTPEMKPLNFWDLVNVTLSMMGAQLKRIVITRNLQGKSPMVLGDWNLLQQVLVNLLLNASGAIKKCPEPELTITCCVPVGVKTTRICIEDNGIGIRKHHLNKIFEPFFTQGKKEGFGLGLFISRRVIENHGGIIYAESDLKRGSLMIIEMPLITSDTMRKT